MHTETEGPHSHHYRTWWPHSCLLLVPAAFFFFSSSFGLSHRIRDNPVWSLRDGWSWMCPFFCSPDTLNYGQEASHILTRSYWSSELPGLCLFPARAEQQSRYKWSDLHRSRSMETAVSFAFLCTGKLQKDVPKMIDNGRSSWTDTDRETSHTYMCISERWECTAYSLEINIIRVYIHEKW